jgi:hypothetical protein
LGKENWEFHYRRLEVFLRGVSFRLRIFHALEGVLLLLSGLLLVLLGSLFPPAFEGTFSYLPFVYSLTAFFLLLFLLFRGLWRVASRRPLQRVAQGVEERFPQLRDDVTNSLLLWQQIRKDPPPTQVSERLIRAQVRRTADKISTLRLQEVVSFKKTFRSLRLLVPMALAFAGVLFMDPHFGSRSLSAILNPFATLPVRITRIAVEPQGLLVLRGSPLTIRAEATGSVPDRLSLILWPEGREELRLNMEPEGKGRFIYHLAQAQRSFRYRATAPHGVSPVYRLQVVDPPEVGKVKLTLYPPEYTRLPAETKEDGHLEALKGTAVNLVAWATKKVQEGIVVLNQENELPLKVQGDRLSGSLLVFSPGTYFIKMKDEHGFENPNPVQYQIRLIPDQYPTTEIISPSEDLEIAGGEVIPIVYTAKDDFGITALKLGYQIGGEEHWLPLQSSRGERSFGPETFRWDLASLALTSGEQVIYRLGVWDNDSVSGPKIAYSRSYTLSVRDEKARAAREGEEAQKIADAVLNLLADHLESKKEQGDLIQSMDEILKTVEKNLERTGERAGRFDFEALQRNLASLKERMGRESPETVTQEMERLALLAEDIAKRARMDEVEALTRELRNRQRRLVDSLNDIKGAPSREGLEAIQKELKKLEDLLRSVMEALGKMATPLPDDFVNSPEMKGLDFQDLFKDLDEIYKKLKAGDLAGALEAAQRLLQALSEMMAALGRAGAQGQMSAFDKLQGEMRQQSGELDKILAEQQKILGETGKMDQEVKEQVAKEIEKRFNRSLPEIQEILNQIENSLPPEQKEATAELKKLLREKQLGRFLERVGELEKEFSSRPGERALLQDLRQKTAEWNAGAREILTQGEKENFSALSSRQNQLQERTGDLKEKLEMLAQLFPGMDTGILNDMREAAHSMGQAGHQLKEEDAPGAIPPEQEAIRRLTKSQQSMQQMAQQMAQQMQASRWGYQLGYDPRPGWYYGPWAPMPTLPQPEFRRPPIPGYTGIDREEFAPPAKDAYRVPKIFREKVLEGLKEEVPSQYKREVERYFRGLTE